MDRRRFLDTVMWSAAGALLPRAVAAEIFWPSPASICHTPSGQVPTFVAATASADRLVYEGSHIIAFGAMRALSNAYPGPLEVRGGGCDNAVLSVRQGTADVGGMCCPVEGSPGAGLPSLVIARDIKAVVVHPTNPLAGLDMTTLHGIASGRIARWNQLGGPDRPVALVVRQHCADYREPIRTMLLPQGTLWSPRTLFVDNEPPLVDTVAAFPAAIGIASWVFAKPLVDAGKLKLVAVDGVLPSPETAANGRYRLTAPLSLIYRQWKKSMNPLFEFIYGDEGRRIIAERLVPVTAREAGYRRS